MSVWREQIALFKMNTKEILIVDMATSKTKHTLKTDNEAEKPLDLKSRFGEVSNALYVSHLVKAEGGQVESFICLHLFDIVRAKKIATRHIRLHDNGNVLHCVSNSLRTFCYFSNHTLVVLALIEGDQEVRIAKTIDDIENVYKISPIRENDFIVFFKRKSTGEVLYYVTHEIREIATKASGHIISALGYSNGRIERLEIA